MKTFELDFSNCSGRCGHQKFYFMLSIPDNRDLNFRDIDIGAANCGKAKYLCPTIKKIPNTLEEIESAIRHALGAGNE